MELVNIISVDLPQNWQARYTPLQDLILKRSAQFDFLQLIAPAPITEAHPEPDLKTMLFHGNSFVENLMDFQGGLHG